MILIALYSDNFVVVNIVYIVTTFIITKSHQTISGGKLLVTEDLLVATVYRHSDL